MTLSSAARPVRWRVAALLVTLSGCAAGQPVEVSTSRRPPTTTAAEPSVPTPAERGPEPSTSTTIPAVTATTAAGRLQVASRRPPTTTSTTRSGPGSTTTTSTRPEPTTTTTATVRPAGDGTVVDMAATPDGTGGWVLTADGTVRAVGAAKHLGDRSGRLSAPAVEIAPTRSGRGYFITTAAGEVFVFGDAVHAGNLPPGYEVTGMVADPDGYGYWMVTPDGYFMTFQENFYAPSPGRPNTRSTPIVAVATDPTRSGDGASTGWHPVTAGGEVLFYGSWAGYGEPRPDQLSAPIVDIAATPTGGGYTLVDSAGHVHPFGDATLHGHAQPATPVVSIAITPANKGYWITTADGTILPFGDATNLTR